MATTSAEAVEGTLRKTPQIAYLMFEVGEGRCTERPSTAGFPAALADGAG
jgi:hypothetical protein